MTKANLKFKEHSLVFLGRFDPVIFNPHWLVRKGLISNDLAEAAEVNVISTELSEFKLEPYKILVLADRFIITSVEEMHFDQMRDTTLGIFQFLAECPIYQMGINYHHHYDFESTDDYVNFGHMIVPKEDLWNKVMPDSRLASINIVSERQDEYKGQKIATVKISAKVMHGVEIQVNDHYDFYKTDSLNDDIDASIAVETLKKQWQISIDSSTQIIGGICEYGCSSAS